MIVINLTFISLFGIKKLVIFSRVFISKIRMFLRGFVIENWFFVLTRKITNI